MILSHAMIMRMFRDELHKHIDVKFFDVHSKTLEKLICIIPLLICNFFLLCLLLMIEIMNYIIKQCSIV